jgi:hypothetical protein
VLTAWRDRLGGREEYVRQARAAQSQLGAVPASASLAALEQDASFEAADDALRVRLEEILEQDPSDEGLEARCRAARGRFWSQAEPERMERWALIESVARVLRLAGEVERPLAQGKTLDAVALSARYTDDGTWGLAWSELDTAHRHMERRFHTHDLDPGGRDARLERLVARARQRHASFVAAFAELWLRGVAARGFAAAGAIPQRQTFAHHVRPLLGEGAIAYLLVDGLRFEMARELKDSLQDLGAVSLGWTMGTLPSITEIGMAALLPGAEEGARLEVGRDDRLGLVIGGKLLRNRKERMEYLQQQVPGAVILKLGDVLPSKRGIREKLATAPLVVVTITDELDGLGDGVNPEMSRRLMDDVLADIRRAVKVLFQLGVRHAVVTADHGHLFGESLESDRHIRPPGGQKIGLHRRVWIGRGGAADPAFVRFEAAQLGLGGDLEVVTPWGTGCFTAPGATGGYFHGGGSPQELIVPVLSLRSTLASAQSGSRVSWTLTPSRPRLTTMIATFLVGGDAEGLFTDPVRRVRIEVREGREVIGGPTAAAYGLDEATGELALEYEPAQRAFRINTVTVRLDRAPKTTKIKVVMLDARTDQPMAHADLEAVIAAW